MNEKHSLLDNIKSKYILKEILILTFRNMNSVFKFVAYNKVLLNRLDINIKDYYNYEIKAFVEKAYSINLIGNKIFDIVFFWLILLIYKIFAFKKKIDDKKLKKDYNKKMKNYVEIMNNYITIIYLVYFLIYFLFLLLHFIISKIVIKGKYYFICEIIYTSIILSYFIEQIIKCYCQIKIGNKVTPDIILIIFIIIDLINDFIKLYTELLSRAINCKINEVGDKYSIYLNQINGININEYELPNEFDDLDKTDKIKMIFKKENMTQYTYILNDIQKMLINKINQIRNQNNIPELKYDKYQKLPNYIINPKTELIFKEEKNIYKFYNYYYLIKYPISECQKDINDYNFINIIKINYLDRINIIRKDNYEYIALYTDQFNENNTNNNRRVNNNINTYRNLRLNPIIIKVNNINTEDRLNNNNQ